MKKFQHPGWKKILSAITRLKPRLSKVKERVTSNINPKIARLKSLVITKVRPQTCKVKAYISKNIGPGFNKVKTRVKPQINKLKSKMPDIKLPAVNVKFLRANLGQLGIILMLGIFVTTGMIGNIYAAHSEDTITSSVKAHRVMLNGKEAGYVCDQESARIVMDEVLQDAAENFGMEVSAEHKLVFEEVTISPELLSTKAELERTLRQFSEINVNAYVIYADDEKIGTLRSQEDAEKVLNDIKAQYVDDISQLEDAFFQEEVEIVPTPVSFHEIEDIETVENKIQEGQDTVEEYIVKEGDTFWSIAKHFQIDPDELTQMNKDMDPEKLQLGETIRLSHPKSLLNVVTTEVVEYEVSIPYQTETQEDSSMFNNESKVVKNGEEGLKQVEARIVKVNGIEQEREILSQEVIKEPVNKIVKKGTKTPVSRGTGRMSWPAQGRLTSRYGRRWGRLHKGIDIANSTGTPIYAADSGKVIYSGWSGGYGNLVKIDHGGGIVTFYAHMSKRAVSSGSSVSKGQLIGYIGNTGNSTGPHLHFEVRVNGSPKNPINYLP